MLHTNEEYMHNFSPTFYNYISAQFWDERWKETILELYYWEWMKEKEKRFTQTMSGKARTMMFINIHFTLLDNEQKPQTNSARKLRVTILLTWYEVCVTYSISEITKFSLIILKHMSLICALKKRNNLFTFRNVVYYGTQHN